SLFRALITVFFLRNRSRTIHRCTLSLHDALPIFGSGIVLVFDSITGFPRAVLFDNGYLTDLRTGAAGALAADLLANREVHRVGRSEEHTSELSHVSISYAVFCLKKKKRI